MFVSLPTFVSFHCTFDSVFVHLMLMIVNKSCV